MKEKEKLDPERREWDRLEVLTPERLDGTYPGVTIVVPTFNNAQKIGITLESLLNQDYPTYEIIVVDSGSTDRTLEMVRGFREERIRLYTVALFDRYEMLNKGISLAKGTYLNFIFPGDYYIHKGTLRTIMGCAINANLPSLVYCGCLLRAPQKEPTVLFRELTIPLLRRGQQPTSLQSCWFHKDTFKEIGKFDVGYTIRGGLDLLCRFMLKGGLQYSSTNKVLTDYDLRLVTRSMVVHHFFETMRIVFRYFGLLALFPWVLRQGDLRRYFELLLRSIKLSLFEKGPED